jgi:hypothetical protein
MAMTGSEFLKQMWDVVDPHRDALALKQMLDGNTPNFLNNMRACTTEAIIDGKYYRCTYQVMPQYLAIGSDADFVLWPLTQPSLQAFCNAKMLTFSDGSSAQRFYIPTRKIVKNTWKQSDCKIIPQPISRVSSSNPTGHPGTKTETIATEQKMINAAMMAAGCNLRAFSRPKKAYIVRPNLDGRHMAFGGWFYPGGNATASGKPFLLSGDPPYRTDVNLGGGSYGSQIQPWDSDFHEDTYEDYSHGCDLVYYQCDVNGMSFTFDELCNHPKLHVLVSDEGAFNPRFPNAGPNALPALNKTGRMPPAETVAEAKTNVASYAANAASGAVEALNQVEQDSYPTAEAPLGIDGTARAGAEPNEGVFKMFLFGLGASAVGAYLIHRAKKEDVR